MSNRKPGAKPLSTLRKKSGLIGRGLKRDTRGPGMSAADPSPQAFPSAVGRYAAATRPAFLSITVIGALLGFATAAYDNVPINVALAVFTVLFICIAHAGVNVLNDYYDALSGTDAANKERIYPFTGGSRFIQTGLLTLHQTRVLGFGLLAVASAMGIWLTAQLGLGLLLLSSLGIVLGWAYSAPPLQLMSRGLGEFTVVSTWVLVVAVSDFTQRRAIAPLPYIAGLPYALMVGSILYMHQFPDHKADAAVGKRTVVVRLGPVTASWLYLVITLGAYGLIALGIMQGSLPRRTAIACAPILLTIGVDAELRKFSDEPAKLQGAIVKNLGAAHLFGTLLTLAIASSRFF